MPYIGEIRLFAGNFAPAGWELCQGQLMSIAESDTLFMLFGATYGGDGETTFALPDLRGRAPIHQGTLSGQTFKVGQEGGTELVPLTPAEIPSHSHRLQSFGGNPSQTSPAGALLSDTGPSQLRAYGTSNPKVALAPTSVAAAGNGVPHDNMQPFLAVSYVISVFGEFPNPHGSGPAMDQRFVGEIRYFPYNFAPVNWAPCNGALYPISQNVALFSVIGTAFGGNGQSTFAVPNLRSATAIGTGQGPGLSNRRIGDSGGEAAVPLTEANLPSHSHSLSASAAPGSSTSPENQVPATNSNLEIYGPPLNMRQMNVTAIGSQGQGTPHNNLQPYLVLNPCIALNGYIPPRQ